MNDRQLIMRFKRGDIEALAAIYDKYAGLLVKIAGGMLSQRQPAEDVVHDVFVKFAHSASTLELKGSLKAYLITCVANRARDQLRKKNPVPAAAEKSTHAGPAQDAIRQETGRLVRQALASLPDEQREAVVLHVQADLTFREIAGMLGVSINTVQSRCRYGMEKLKGMLDGELKP